MERVHGSAVTLGGRGLLILGPSGSGKSALALGMMALGADLVGDDQIELRRTGDLVVMDAPDAICGRIEARGVGILAAHAAGPVPVALVVDLGQVETERLPPWRELDVMGMSLPLVLGPMRDHLCVALRQYLLAGRQD